MNINFQHLIPGDFDDNSHVWIYQSNRLFTTGEGSQIEQFLQNFTRDWQANGIPIKGYSGLFFNQLIVLMLDHTTQEVGNETDNYLRLIKSIEKIFEVDLFDRSMLAFIIQERIQVLPLSRLNFSIEKDFITAETLYFNNAVLTKKQLLNTWIIPVKESWLAKRVETQVVDNLPHESLY